jgi:hypothetical protein
MIKILMTYTSFENEHDLTNKPGIFNIENKHLDYNFNFIAL